MELRYVGETVGHVSLVSKTADICLCSPKVLGLYLHELGKIAGPKPSMCRCAPLTEEELMVPGAFIRGFKCKCEM
jgi:hypothetical protein